MLHHEAGDLDFVLVESKGDESLVELAQALKKLKSELVANLSMVLDRVPDMEDDM